ncbi:hypothetical protein CBR_g16052 [Chara braunii]|uniref:tRNA-binding domain-containing protein n=1 Tax=Chara braunii TaxID=69332 RepID=A0A388JT17_CHABU|nr:hypothetical protein CBR_g16052 [Chara braunii]|eukprot:GBG60930.1 hypothetical protein CBR_g16052 [Chara braunii]
MRAALASSVSSTDMIVLNVTGQRAYQCCTLHPTPQTGAWHRDRPVQVPVHDPLTTNLVLVKHRPGVSGRCVSGPAVSPQSRTPLMACCRSVPAVTGFSSVLSDGWDVIIGSSQSRVRRGARLYSSGDSVMATTDTPTVTDAEGAQAEPAVVATPGSPAAPAGIAGSDEGEGTKTTEDDNAIVDSLDIRIGKIMKAWKHPEADSLYVEEVDLGEETGPRTICSGLVKYIPEAEMQGRSVVVLANLKPRNMRGVKSNGMLLAASDAAHENVELVSPPVDAVVGDRVWFGEAEDKGRQKAPATANQVQKKKVWETVQPRLKTNEEGVVVYNGNKPMRVDTGVVNAPSLKGANVS